MTNKILFRIKIQVKLFTNHNYVIMVLVMFSWTYIFICL